LLTIGLLIVAVDCEMGHVRRWGTGFAHTRALLLYMHIHAVYGKRLSHLEIDRTLGGVVTSCNKFYNRIGGSYFS